MAGPYTFTIIILVKSENLPGFQIDFLTVFTFFFGFLFLQNDAECWELGASDVSLTERMFLKLTFQLFVLTVFYIVVFKFSLIKYNGSIILSKNTGCDGGKKQNLRPNCNLTPYYYKRKLQSDKTAIIECYYKDSIRKALACERRRISGCHCATSDSRKYVCVRRLWIS